ncbi:MAG TPA: hypothetical protein VGG30_10305, partial [Pirellulales bacterium]
MTVGRVIESAAVLALLLGVAFSSGAVGTASADDDSAAGTPAKAEAPASLAGEQKQIAERFDKLKEKLLR